MSDDPRRAEAHRSGSTWQWAIVRARRLNLLRLSVVAATMLLVGVAVGRESVPETDPDVRAVVEEALQPLVLDADGLWTSAGDEELPPVSEGIQLVHAGERLAEVRSWSEEWLRAYDNLVVELAVPDLAPAARPVQRQFIAAVTLSRDAVEVLQHATGVTEGGLRRTLVDEVLRLRQRSEDLTQSARASLRDLDGGESDVSVPPDLPGL